MFKDTMEFYRLMKRTNPDGCGGDCENCACWSSCSYAYPAPDENYDDSDED